MRGGHTRWKKGKPKTGGRLKGVCNKATFEIKAACQAVGPLILERLEKLALYSNDGATATRAASLILSYGYGKPTERVEVTGADGGAILVQPVEAEQAAREAKGRVLRLLNGGLGGDGAGDGDGAGARRAAG